MWKRVVGRGGPHTSGPLAVSLHEAAAGGAAQTVHRWLQHDPALVHRRNPEGILTRPLTFWCKKPTDSVVQSHR